MANGGGTNRNLGPLIGRENEMEALRRDLGDAVGGCGRCVLLLGDAGIGKTRTGTYCLYLPPADSPIRWELPG